MKIDSHQHFWKFNTTEYAWIGENMSVLKRDFLPENLYQELEQLGFDGSIAVQARQCLEETHWLLELAGKNEFIKGVVGWVDLCSSEIEVQLENFSKNIKLIGVRHVVHDEPDDYFMARNDFQHGIGLLSKYGLTYDLLIFQKHLALANELVKQFPNQKFILDHIAKPLIKEQIRAPWDAGIRKLAENKNVYCKLSGMVTEADWKLWKSSDFEFYIDTVFEAFGEDRLMIGSDWPVCTVAGNYSDVMHIVIDYFKGKDKRVLDKILGINCERIYSNR